MSITERLANLSIPTVIIIIIVLVAARYLLLRQKTQFTKSLAEIAESLAVAMGLVFLIIRPFIVQAFFIPSPSMVPTLMLDDHILVNKFIYRFKEPQRFDVVVFKAPADAMTDVKDEVNREADELGLNGDERKKYVDDQLERRAKDFIKRVIAVPGDEVKITPGYILIGSRRIEHDELRSIMSQFTATGMIGPVRLYKDKIFVEGKEIPKNKVAEAFGAPNSEVIIHPGTVYINGKPLDEPYLNEDPGGERYPSPGSVDPSWLKNDKDGDLVVKIPDGKLLVMGDNRNESNDARRWGLLDRDRVIGKAMFIFWPLNRIRWIH